MFSSRAKYVLCLWRVAAAEARRSQSSFVPKHNPAKEEDIDRLSNFLSTYENILILTGAGISTESGIPDYRSEGVGLYARSTNRPVQYRDFLKSEAVRQRYWARNFVGWPRFSSTMPNATHFAISNMQTRRDSECWVVTQNVDGLHRKAGCEKIIELHGTAYKVICLDCSYSVHRHLFQQHLSHLNPHMQTATQALRPDGDVEMHQEDVDGFVVPSCTSCGGILKPDIVFFGDNVPKERVKVVQSNVALSDAVLVLGSTLTVFSAYRIILQASELKKPIAIVNIGETRGDKHASVKVDAKCGDIIPRLLR